MRGSTKNNPASAKKRIRTCIACGAHQGKMSLHRVVRTPDGAVEYDPTGRAAGRGAYICSSDCLKKAFDSKRLDNALKVKVEKQDKERIADIMRQALDEE